MLGVLEAFGVIAVVIVVGYIAGRRGVLGDNARTVLNRVAFHIGVPALLILNLSEATVEQIFSPSLVVSAIAALLAFGLCFLVIAGLRRRNRGESTIAAWVGSYVNAGNLGIPLSAYVFGSTTEISALIMFQAVVMAPIGIAILNSEASPKRSPGRQALALVTNPIIAASAAGLLMAALGWSFEAPFSDPLEMLAALAIPTVLLAFGISLATGVEDATPANRTDLAIVVGFKLILMPLGAYAIAKWGFGADDEHVLLTTVLAALPSAQNINTYAAVYRRNETLTRDATLISTAASVPVILAIVAVLG